MPHPSDDGCEVSDAGFEDKQLHLLRVALGDESGTSGQAKPHGLPMISRQFVSLDMQDELYVFCWVHQLLDSSWES